jgi:hypothetical protein
MSVLFTEKYFQINMKVHVCLTNPGDIKDDDGSEKDAIVEIILEYEWASQDDRHEIIPVDYKGDIFLNKIPSPSPGESLNVTLISRLGSQIFFLAQGDYHQGEASHSTSISYDEDGPVDLSLCHQRETVQQTGTIFLGG